jgi:hypothetical protein
LNRAGASTKAFPKAPDDVGVGPTDGSSQGPEVAVKSSVNASTDMTCPAAVDV